MVAFVVFIIVRGELPCYLQVLGIATAVGCPVGNISSSGVAPNGGSVPAGGSSLLGSIGTGIGIANGTVGIIRGVGGILQGIGGIGGISTGNNGGWGFGWGEFDPSDPFGNLNGAFPAPASGGSIF